MKITVASLWAFKLFRPEETQFFGGAELQLYFLSRELAKNPENTVQFITRGHGPAETFESEGIRVYKIPYRENPALRMVLGMRDLYRQLVGLDTDLFLQRGGGVESGLTAMAASRKRKPYLFMTCHDWDVDGTNEKRLGLIGGWLLRRGMKRADFVIAQSQWQKEKLREHYGKESVVMRSAHPMPAAVPENKKGVLWVGRCEYWKGPKVFLDLAEALPEHSFTMVCQKSNVPEMFEELSARAARLPNVTFIPGIPYEETEPLFASHRIMANTSVREGYPNTYVQCFKWGAPVITQHINPDGLLESNRMGIQAGHNFNDLTAAARRLLEDEREWKEYSANARRFALENHNVEKIAADIYRIMKDLQNSYE
ncbi:MAG: glycosyltransferase family 4 protein [Candidatus Omnitrophota bacterium]